jgi:transposase
VVEGTAGLTRGDRRRNARVEVLRAVVARDWVILAIDLGEDVQVAALVDHEGRVLGRRVARVKAHALGGVLGWAAARAAARGCAGVVVGCEPTGHRWRAVMALADAAGMGMVCVQPLKVARARESDDGTLDKTDHKDAVLIGRLIARLDCYLPERPDAEWARLRHLGGRRRELAGAVIACGQRITELVACACPALLSCAAQPLESTTWLACLAVAARRVDPGGIAGPDTEAGFLAAVRGEVPRFGARRVCRRIAVGFWAALSDPGGVAAQRPGAVERAGLLLADRADRAAAQAEVEARMLGVLDRMGLGELVCSIPGLSALGAALILAETGDITRFATARSVVKHAGLNPTEHTSATLRGHSRVSKRGRPALRAAAWRALWAALIHNPVLRAKYQHLTTRERDRLAPGQARAACAATLLRWLHAIITRRIPWQADIATGDVRPGQGEHAAA